MRDGATNARNVPITFAMAELHILAHPFPETPGHSYYIPYGRLCLAPALF